VLHTRISEELAEDIRRIADDLRVPVSNIVRNVLEEAFSMVETVTENMGDLVDEVVDEAEAARERIVERHGRRGSRRREAQRRRAPAPAESAGGDDEILGWQPLMLHRSQNCADCDALLERGEHAFVAVTARGVSARFACAACVAPSETTD
jgi:hypothetical protein